MSAPVRLPKWLKPERPGSRHAVKSLLRRYHLATVCEEARCPNAGNCFEHSVATFMILGSVCTRNCGFCAISTGMPAPVDAAESGRVAAAAREMGLKYVVITSVSRDDLPDGGARHFAATVRAVRQALPGAGVEVLTPDFRSSSDALEAVLDSGPDVFNHNIETAMRLYPTVRPEADYDRSLSVLAKAKEMKPDLLTKSGFMLGLGETDAEVISLLTDLRSASCDIVTIGQYLRPTRNNLPVVEYVDPERFGELREEALEMGFKYAASGPLVRSSMNAEEMYRHV